MRFADPKVEDRVKVEVFVYTFLFAPKALVIGLKHSQLVYNASGSNSRSLYHRFDVLVLTYFNASTCHQWYLTIIECILLKYPSVNASYKHKCTPLNCNGIVSEIANCECRSNRCKLGKFG